MRLYQKLFAAIYDWFMDSTEQTLELNRRELLSHLEGNVLEVGVGTGVNFRYFNDNASIMAIEPSAPMLKKAIPKIPAGKKIEVHNLGVNDEELEELIAENSLDAVVCTLVLCTIPDPQLALEKFKRWLKPEGQLVVLEHIRSKHHWHGRMQDWVNPIWKAVGEGCNLNRNTDAMITAAGFVAVEETYFKNSVTWYQGVFTLQ
jgi:ubiquinone/menaquinone biosynthesis C-methylase UbiE